MEPSTHTQEKAYNDILLTREAYDRLDRVQDNLSLLQCLFGKINNHCDQELLLGVREQGGLYNILKKTTQTIEDILTETRVVE